ncbi:prephenate dehydrogenase [Capnocytophaga felis]|uniref:Prephenate dehydrogenase n=1 Tax=Capnocytophaga felis TaxID=2267611 RepID=A0A5M4B616_9FLAO|nr:prephenate dehydrogenase [Capnocytophaga felis]GET45064.1 prephenate dehydrogenase [Capnocytophaga felis]GET47772.1 prephenate dehydrogenase [Capnocytophaga felis]
MKTAVIIGLGLIGGSMALELRKRCGYEIWGIDTNPNNVQKALELGIINKETDYNHIAKADVAIIAVPVNIIPKVLKKTLDHAGKQTVVMDMGSVKEHICQSVSDHPNRGNFIASHPMAGTEFSGPEAAIYNLFDNKVMVFCETEKSNNKLLEIASDIVKALRMRLKTMSPKDHDRHVAYVSHLSHVSSFMLGKTVLEIEKDEQNIFDLASTGFASTVRLAKSDADMWCPIFLENKENVLKSLDEYIKNLNEFRIMIQNHEEKEIRTTIKEINHIRKVLRS